MIAKTAIIYPHVELGSNVTIEDYCIIGASFVGHKGERTSIGDNAVIRSHTVIYAGNIIGRGFMTGNKVNIRELNNIGDDVSIGTHSIVEHHITIADGVRVHSQVFIPEFSTLESNAWIGPNVVLTNAKYPKSPDAKKNLKGPTIKRGAKIGANSTILPAVVIGQNALIGAGSVVVDDIEEGAVAVGNPARVIKQISDLPYEEAL